MKWAGSSIPVVFKYWLEATQGVYVLSVNHVSDSESMAAGISWPTTLLTVDPLKEQSEQNTILASAYHIRRPVLSGFSRVGLAMVKMVIA